MSDDQAWTEKYRPTTTNGSGANALQGNNKASKEIKRWAQNYTKGDKPRLLVGPPGVGKSSCIQSIANDLGLPLLEINASDARRTAEVNEFVREAFTTPFGFEKQLVMFDESDSMSGRTNFSLLYKLLDDSPNPVVFIANEEWEVLNGIKKRCEVYKFRLGTRSIKAKLKKIIAEEDLDIGASTLTQLAQRESLRDAIADLQSIAQGEDLTEDSRQYETSVFDEVDKVIKGKEANFSETPPDVLLWIDQNIRDRWRLTEAMMAWDCLSRSDKWLGRVNGSDYSWWKYAGSLQDQVPHLRLSDAWDGYIDKERPEKMKRGWGRGVEGRLYEKLSGGDKSVFYMGVDFHTFESMYLPILKDATKDRKLEIVLEHNLEDDEMKCLGVSPSEYEDYREGGDVELAEERSNQESEVKSFMEW